MAIESPSGHGRQAVLAGPGPGQPGGVEHDDAHLGPEHRYRAGKAPERRFAVAGAGLSALDRELVDALVGQAEASGERGRTPTRRRAPAPASQAVSTACSRRCAIVRPDDERADSDDQHRGGASPTRGGAPRWRRPRRASRPRSRPPTAGAATRRPRRPRPARAPPTSERDASRASSLAPEGDDAASPSGTVSATGPTLLRAGRHHRAARSPSAARLRQHHRRAARRRSVGGGRHPPGTRASSTASRLPPTRCPAAPPCAERRCIGS